MVSWLLLLLLGTVLPFGSQVLKSGVLPIRNGGQKDLHA